MASIGSSLSKHSNFNETFDLCVYIVSCQKKYMLVLCLLLSVFIMHFSLQEKGQTSYLSCLHKCHKWRISTVCCCPGSEAGRQLLGVCDVLVMHKAVRWRCHWLHGGLQAVLLNPERFPRLLLLRLSADYSAASLTFKHAFVALLVGTK